MTRFMCKPAAESRRTTALLAAAAGVALWGVAMAAQAGDQPSAQPAADAHNGAVASSKPAKPDPQDRVVCRQEEETGSRLGGHRICHTNREWDQIARDSGDMLNHQSTAGRPQ
jgi:hypothetical protein